MTNTIAMMALAITLSFATAAPGAEADIGRHGHHFSDSHRHSQSNYRGRGHYVKGKWIALGILGAFASGAIYGDRDCYRRRGRTYCN